MFVILLRVPFYLLLVSHCITRPSSIRFLLMSLGLFVLGVIHLSVSVFVILLRVPFLSPTCESLHYASFIYLFHSVVCAPFCFVVHRGCRGEEGGSDLLASWEDKRIDIVASSWRYFSTQSIISDPPPPFFEQNSSLPPSISIKSFSKYSLHLGLQSH
jgi:hypothetical protein